MNDYVRDMVEELNGLNGRLERIKAAVDDEGFMDSIGNEKATLLDVQYHAMETYAFILAQRLLVELNEGSCTLEDVQGDC